MEEYTIAHSSKKKWKRWPIALLATALAVVGFGIFRVIQTGNRAEAHTEALLRRLSAAGDPVSLHDLARVHASYAANGNAAPHYDEIFAIQPASLPVKLDRKTTQPGPKDAVDLRIDEPLPEEMAKEYRSFVETNQVYYSLLDKLKDAPRFAVENLDFPAGPNMLLPHIAKFKQTVMTLQLRCYWHIHQNNADAALEDLALIMRVSEALAPEHILISHLVRQACAGVGIRTGERLLNLCALNDAQLARLQEIFRRHPTQKDLRNALAGERAFGLHAFTMPAAFAGTGMTAAGARVGSSVWHEDRLLYLQLLTELVDATTEPLPEALRAADRMEKEMFAKIKPPGSPIMNWFNLHVRRRYILTGMLVPALTKALERSGEGIARARLLDTAAAVERYRLKHGRFPAALSEMGERTEFSVDPFTGKALGYKITPDGFTLYSVGRDLIDNNGTPPKSGSVKRDNEDIVFSVRTAKRGH